MINFKEIFSILISGNPDFLEIIGTTLIMSFSSSIIAFLIGGGLGLVLGCSNGKAKKLISRINRTLMGLPPVLAGLVVFLLLSGTGALGKFQLVYTVQAMIIAQVLLITPITMGLTEASISVVFPEINQAAKGLNLGRGKRNLLLLNESKYALVSTFLAGFSRSIAEVGAVQLVGGNILHKTRVMTTSIVLETNMGNFSKALAIGIVLLLISFVVNAVVTFIGEKK